MDIRAQRWGSQSARPLLTHRDLPFQGSRPAGWGHWRGPTQLQRRNLCFLKAPVLGTPTGGNNSSRDQLAGP